MNVALPRYFHPLIRHWFAERVGTPTDIQLSSWASIRQGEHTLLTAPTGSGKTLAAFLWALNQLVCGDWPGGSVRVLYVSPMKALNNDVQLNLDRPLREIGDYFRKAGQKFPAPRVLTRSGDTPASERRSMYGRPPEILITTPESLNILVTSKSGRALLTGLHAVIVDEIHAVLPDKRGTHLITAVDRLVLLSGEFQRIALSATVRPLETVAEFIGGATRLPDGRRRKRPVRIICSTAPKKMALQVASIPAPPDGADNGDWWPALGRAFREIIAAHQSTLFFTNSRRLAEKITRLINENEEKDLAYSHHGSLSKEIRLAVEQKLKDGRLKAIVATNSLELGIDIGALDRVVLIQSPQSVASAIQRIGRSGHRVGDTSTGLLFPLNGKDFLQAAVLGRAVLDRDIDAIRPVDNPLDVLAQVILAMVVAEKWDVGELFETIRCSHPYRTLQRPQFDRVVAMLAGRYADSRVRELRGRIRLDTFDNAIEARDGAPFLLYTGGGTIPDRGAYTLRHQETGARLGELDEEFVWERRRGETFTLGTQAWQIRTITHNDVEVVPVAGGRNLIPFWKGESLRRSFHLSEKIGTFLEACNTGVEEPEMIEQLCQRHCFDRPAAEYLQSYLIRQKACTGADLPHRHHLLLEYFNDPLSPADTCQAILHTFWGSPVNAPFSLALAAAWEEKHGHALTVFSDNDCILLMLPAGFDGADLLGLVNTDNLERHLRKKLERSAYFGARFRENAGRALLLPRPSLKKRMPLWLNRLRAKSLFEAVATFADFPIILETWRECFHDHFDLPALKMLLDELDAGALAVTEVTTRTPSPFAEAVVWQQTNTLMYADDTPGDISSSLSDALLTDLVFGSQLRPDLEPGLLGIFLGKLQRTLTGYAPLTAADLIDWIEERLLIPESEWQNLLQATVRDSGLQQDDLLAAISHRVVLVRLPGTPTWFACAIGRLPFLAESFRLGRGDLAVRPLSDRAEPTSLIEASFSLYRQEQRDSPADRVLFLGAWLAYYGPVPITTLKQYFDTAGQPIEDAIAELEEAKQVVRDTFSRDSAEIQICDAANLEILLRMMRRARQPSFAAVDCARLPLFLAAHQGLTGPGTGIEALQYSLDTLFGYPAPCAAWEEHILPIRVRPYQTAHLDSLLQSTDLIWYGCGAGKTAFSFLEDLELFGEPAQQNTPLDEQLACLFPERKGKYTVVDLQEFSRLDSAALTEMLWSLVWQGRIANDSYTVLRKGIMNRFTAVSVGDRAVRSRRSGFARWQASRPFSGAFYRLPVPESGTPRDSLAGQELIKDRVRQLLCRYGIIFRELLVREAPELQWKGIYRTVRLMELSGEILAGYFFDGVDSPQFISPDAFRKLQEPPDEECIFWLNACDPASLCGLGPERLRRDLPRRIASNFLVYHGSRLSLVLEKNGRELDIRVAPGHPRLADYLKICRDLLSREFRPRRTITVETINGASAAHSPYREDLIAFGFSASHRGLELRKNA